MRRVRGTKRGGGEVCGREEAVALVTMALTHDHDHDVLSGTKHPTPHRAVPPTVTTTYPHSPTHAPTTPPPHHPTGQPTTPPTYHPITVLRIVSYAHLNING